MTDNKKILKVLKGFTELNTNERAVLITELNDFINKSELGKENSKRELRTKLFSALGPTNDNNCPCCGKS